MKTIFILTGCVVVLLLLMMYNTRKTSMDRYTEVTDPAQKLAEIHEQLRIDHGSIGEEVPEQLMSIRFIRPSDRVLEIGGNIGRNSCVIAKLLRDSRQLVVLESNPGHAEELKQNRDQNNLQFAIEARALSKRRLIQNGWNTKPIEDSDSIIEGWNEIPTIGFRDLIQKYPKGFNVLVLDCEGAFYYILLDFPEILRGVRTIIIENDFESVEQGKHVHDTLRRAGFRVVHEEPLPDKSRLFADEFFQTWQR